MNKKIFLLILPAILLTFMVLSDIATDTTTTNYTVSDSPMNRWVPAGTSYRFNFTINLTTTEANITAINITVPNGFNITQGTNESSLLTGWAWTNKSNSILIVNTTGQGNFSIGNYTFYIWSNFTADATGAEAATTWTINFSTATGNSTTTSFTGGGIDDLAPRILTTGRNVSDGTLTPAYWNDTAWVNGVASKLNFTVTFNETNNNATSTAIMCWNITTFTAFDGSQCTNSTNMTRAASNLYTSEFTRVLTASETMLYYIFWVEDQLGNKIWINNSEGPFNISSDGVAPNGTSITAPSSTHVIVSGAGITYSCGANDESPLTYTWLLTKPDNTNTVSKTGSSVTFSGNDINLGGSYTLSCTATDSVGLTHQSAASTFTTYSPGGSSNPSGDTPSGATEELLEEISGETYELGSVAASKSQTFVVGDGATLTILGTTHAVVIKEVTSNSATIKIASEPQEITLTIGESKNVDVNGDSTMDLKVTLLDIVSGEANLSFEELEQPVDTTTTGDDEPEPETTSTNLTWLWWLIGVIVVVGLVWYFTTTKKK
ncbi:MAG: hypothetical protein KKH88_00715 [Nanoarchaeota archaeon]|nr:hypothetical protein [Nanoarchaeota archaeon]